MLRSWVDGANSPDTDFPLNNLPYGVFSVDGDDPRCGVAIGDMILDVAAMEAAGLLRLDDNAVLDVPFWNEVMELGPQAWARLRVLLLGFLVEGAESRVVVANYLVPQARARLHMPFLVAEYTEFCAGPQQAWAGYYGRASGVVVSGTGIYRPSGQLKDDFGPESRLDIGAGMGAIVGRDSTFGQPLALAEAAGMVFGYVLLNGWSARDIQAGEHPSAPFQSRGFGTTISPWIVTPAALEMVRCAGPDQPGLLPHLQETTPGFYNVALEVLMQAKEASAAKTVARGNFNRVPYSAAQQLTLHAGCGCAMNAGDLLGSGVISDAPPLVLADGDSVTLRGFAQGDGYRVGFGECTGRILPAPGMTGRA